MDPQASTSKAEASSSKRPRKKVKTDVAPTTGSGDISTPVDNDPTSKPVTNKGKGKAKKQGKLAGLMNMPLDILFEIFGHLCPLDILHLARMTKQFRNVLMHRSAISVWKEARKNVPGLPDCPFDLTEPEWANLAFDQRCHYCSASGVRAVEWRFRARICGKCAKVRLADVRRLSSPGHLAKMIPTRIGKGHVILCQDSDFQAVCKEYYDIDSDDDKTAFMLARKAHVARVIEHAEICEAWAQSRADDRSNVLEERREQRKDAIIDKLVDLGWGVDLAVMSQGAFANLKEVRQPVLLTERIWANIRPAVLAYMETIKTKRLLREHAAIVTKRRRLAVEVLRKYKNSRLPCTEAMPEAADFFAFPEVAPILEQGSEVIVTESTFSDVVSKLPELVTKWQAAIESQLVKKLQSDYVQNNKEDEEHEVDITSFPGNLNLAKNVFVCISCARREAVYTYDSSDSDSDGVTYASYTKPIVKPLYYPEVLAHRCLTRQWSLFHYGLYKDPSLYIRDRRGTRRPWTCRQISLSENMGTIVEQIVRISGLDPSTTTVEDMDKLDARFACITCDTQKSDCYVFGWRSAVAHHGHAHHCKERIWRKLTDDQAREARRQESDFAKASNIDSHLSHLPDQNLPAWECLHCRDLPTEMAPAAFANVMDHVISTHEISKPELNKDFYRVFDSHQFYSEDPLLRFQTSSLPRSLLGLDD